MLKTLTAKLIAGGIVLAIIIVLIFTVPSLWNAWRGAKAQNNVSTNQAVAAQKTGGEAVNTVGNVSAAAQVDQATSKDAQDAINRAQAGNSNDAADAAVCSLRAYRDTERCRELRAVHP